MAQSWLSLAQQSFVEDVEREVKREGKDIVGYTILITDVRTKDWGKKHPYEVIDVHLSVDRYGDVIWDGYMPSDERIYWANHAYTFEVIMPYSKIGSPIYIGGE